MIGLTRQQRAVLDLLRAYIAKHGMAPSFDELKAATGGRSKSNIHRMMLALEERGYIRRLPGRARAIEILPEPANPPGIYRNARNRPSGEEPLLAVLRPHQVDWIKRAALRAGMTPEGFLRELVTDAISAAAEEPQRGRRVEA